MRLLQTLILLLLFSAAESKVDAATHLVRMVNSTFVPQLIDIDVGDTITWTNTERVAHDTRGFDSAGEPVWISPLFLRPGTFSFTFNVPPGTYEYICKPHVDIGMVGTVFVHALVPPTVNITSPANQSTFLEGATINISAAASEGVTKVELIEDNNSVQTLNAAPFDFSLTLPVGAHALIARATNAKGAVADSPPVNISVLSPNQPPAIAITSPTNTAAFQAPIDLTIEAFASHPTGIDHVEFFANGAAIGSDNTAPYAVTRTFTNGAPVTLTAQAFSANSLNALSAPVNITINEAIPSAPQITFLSPTNGFVPFASNIVLAARAVDLDGAIANVKFFNDTNLLGTVETPVSSNRFELLTFLPEGAHTLYAIATDNLGITSTSVPPTSVTVMMSPSITSSNIITSGTNSILRLSFFGTSGFPYVFEYTTNMLNWIPFKTNQLYRRILFFDVPIVPGQPRIYRARSPEPSPLVMFPNPAGTNNNPGGVLPPPPVL
jgi:plastocyanin